MSFKPTNKHRPSYSLIELVVVIGVITVVGLTSFPSIFNRNDRLSLTTSANDLRQFIIDARTRSIAPDKNDSTGSTQQYQVVLGKFPQSASPATVSVSGNIATNAISLERGLAQCDSGDPQGGFSQLRSVAFPRGIYVSSFYPTIQQLPDNQAIIRFTVGQEGFKCGGYNNPVFQSNTVHISGWEGKAGTNSTVARYLTIELSSSKIAEKRYVALDRITGEVIISRTNPQSYFTPVVDNLVPRWKDIDPDNFSLSIACGKSTSEVTIGYPRAKDRVDDPSSVGDPNLFVAYDISWNINDEKDAQAKLIFRPLAIRYFYDLSQDNVNYQFSTDTFSAANQPKKITVNVVAMDSLNQFQLEYASTDLTARQKAFQPTCGAVVSDPPTDPPPPVVQDDPPGNAGACNPVLPQARLHDPFHRLARMFSGRALAAVIPCN